jgi:hypothetical protein
MDQFSAKTTAFETENMNRECYEPVSNGVSQLEITNKFMKVSNLVK